MKLQIHLLFVLLLSVILTVADARSTVKTNCPKECGNCSVHKVGDEWRGSSTTMCARITCKKNRQGISSSGVGCGAFALPPNRKDCYVKPGRVGAPYPDCCPTPVCKKN
ncbi:U-scoloptoxin(16)-Er12a-like isoform X2 [Periplaneta americana]|uniref:U-scoloptoxin(16)-Er12a-like isoform X2 n=1 Tax=Periplaneta americana TaxID=6978 RepID=UPI0037E7700F